MKNKHKWPLLKSPDQPFNIGVFSLHPHAGATYVTILLAEYLSNIVGYKTAVIENNIRSDLRSMQLRNPILCEAKEFELHSITYYCADLSNKQEEVSLQHFEYLVHDLGSSYAKASELIQSCDLTILLFTMTPWNCNWEMLSETLAKDYGDQSRIRLIGNLIPQRLKKQLYQNYHCEFLSYEPDVFEPSLKTIQLFHRILW